MYHGTHFPFMQLNSTFFAFQLIQIALRAWPLATDGSSTLLNLNPLPLSSCPPCMQLPFHLCCVPAHPNRSGSMAPGYGWQRCTRQGDGGSGKPTGC